jgi:predicted O-linked N-acetylglucosamine transferase (SPINDLY family)
LTARNAPCPCGSGRRYKACHGTPGSDAAEWVERALQELQVRDFAAAEASLREAERLTPDDPRIHANLGTVYVRQRRLADAEAPLATALALDPRNGYALTLLAHVRQRRCAWEGLPELHARIAGLLTEEGDHAHADFNPFALLAMPTRLREQLVAARCFARGLTPPSPARRAEVSFASDERLRVGFASSDFRSHAMVTLMIEFWERLDRRCLELFGYGILARDAGPIGQRVERAFEHFADVSGESVPRIAQRIRDDRIAILVDRNGYTLHSREGIFALRPAPV